MSTGGREENFASPSQADWLLLLDLKAGAQLLVMTREARIASQSHRGPFGALVCSTRPAAGGEAAGNLVADWGRLPFGSGSLDAAALPEGASKAERREARRVLRAGGQIYCECARGELGQVVSEFQGWSERQIYGAREVLPYTVHYVPLEGRALAYYFAQVYTAYSLRSQVALRVIGRFPALARRAFKRYAIVARKDAPGD